MAKVKQVVTITKGKSRYKVAKNSNKGGNKNRCPTCGRFR